MAIKIIVGYTNDWTDSATQRVEVIDKTLSGKYVCRKPPTVERGFWGHSYLSYDVTTGIFLKDRLQDIHEEILELKEK